MNPSLRFALVALAGITAPALGGDAPRAPTTYTVTIENMKFTPDTLTVHRGDRVVWTNADLFPHTATAATKAFDSQAIEARASWTYIATTSGEYAYVCTYHPTMKGRLTVR